MKRWMILALALLLVSVTVALAQVSAPPPAPTLAGIVPPPMLGQGVATASTSSAAITATLARTANSAAFPTGNLGGPLMLQPQANAATGVYICWQGGACTASIGEYLAPGQGRTVYLRAQNMTTAPPTMISTGTPAVAVEW